MSFPRTARTFCHMIHSINRVKKRRSPSLDKDSVVSSGVPSSCHVMFLVPSKIAASCKVHPTQFFLFEKLPT